MFFQKWSQDAIVLHLMLQNNPLATQTSMIQENSVANDDRRHNIQTIDRCNATTVDRAASPHASDVHYVNHCRYPESGGVVAYLQGLSELCPTHTNHRVIRISPVTREIEFSNGHKAHYGQLVFSLPFQELIRVMDNVPVTVHEVARQLSCTICVTTNIGINWVIEGQTLWRYFYDQDIVFSGISYPGRLSPNNCPVGCSSIQAEIYFSAKYKFFNGKPETLILIVIDDLIRTNVLLLSDKVIFTDALIIDYANVVYDYDRADALKIELD